MGFREAVVGAPSDARIRSCDILAREALVTADLLLGRGEATMFGLDKFYMTMFAAQWLI
jgi:hypothetical protein